MTKAVIFAACVLPLFAIASANCQTLPRSANPIIARPAQSLPSAGASDVIAAALTWLPADTESIIVVRGPVESEEDRRKSLGVVVETVVLNGVPVLESRAGNPASPTLAARLGSGLPAVLTAIVGTDLADQVARQMVWGLMAGRKFKPPEQIPGAASYEGCYLMTTPEPLAAQIMEVAGRRAVRRGSDGRWPVLNVPTGERDRDREVELYLAQPARGTIAVALESKYLGEMLQRVGAPQQSLAFPPELPQWRQIDTRASVFGLRQIPKDRTTASVAGLAFFADDRQQVLRLGLVAREGDAALTMTKLVAALEGKDAKINAVAAGPLAATADLPLFRRLSDGSVLPTSSYELMLLWMMGWQINL